MRNHGRWAAVVPALVMAATGCGAPADGGSEALGDSAAGPITVDSCGREVVFDSPPERVLAIGSEAPSLLVAAGAGDRLTHYAGGLEVPFDEETKAVVEGAERVTEDSHDVSYEMILSSGVDVVIGTDISSGVDIDTLADRLDQAGVQLLTVSGYCAGSTPTSDPRPRQEHLTMISANDVSVAYDDTLVVDGVGLRAGPGEVVGLIGPNGSGKTTFLRALYAALRPRAGLVTIDDDPVTALHGLELARRVAVVAQETPSDLPVTRYCTSLVMLEGGRVAAAGTPEQVLTPNTLHRVYDIHAERVTVSGCLQLVFSPVDEL